MIKNIKTYKKIRFCLITLIAIILFSGCAKDDVSLSEKEKIVMAVEVKEEVFPAMIRYYGHLEPELIKKFSFKYGGRLKQNNVEIGDVINAGDLLAELDSYEYGLGSDSSKEQLKLAQMDMEKAKQASEYYISLYNDMKSLYESGNISRQQYDEIELQKNIKSKEYEQSIKRVQQAQIDLSYKNQNLSDMNLYSDISGIVVDRLYENGELIPQGYPSIIVRSHSQVAKISVSLEDLKKIELGARAVIEIDEKSYIAEVIHINLFPEQLSRTYEVKLKIDSEDTFLLGQDCRVSIESEPMLGIWIDINYIMNDGVDFVFIAENGRAVRRNIEIQSIYKDKVRVTGIQSGDTVITEGKNSLTEGFKIIVKGDLDE